MTFIKLSSDFVSLESLSQIAQLPKATIEKYFNSMFTMASQMDVESKSDFDKGFKRLALYLSLDKLGLKSQLISDILTAYVTAAGDYETMSGLLTHVLDEHDLDLDLSVNVIDSVLGAFNS